MEHLIADALATYRITRLLQRDTLRPFVALRTVVMRDAPEPVAEAWECAWCLPVWVAAGVSAARLLAPRAWDPVSKALAAAAVASLLLTTVEAPAHA